MKKLLTIFICIFALGAGALLGLKLAGSTPPAEAASAPQPAEGQPSSASRIAITVYKSPTCGCCSDWERHLEQQGFAVTSHTSDDMGAVKAKAGLPPSMASCHTAFVGDYVIEGHVPAADIKRLLQERPAAAGLAAPGMPMGSPGMEVGDRRDAYDVLLFQKDGSSSVFQHHAGN